MKYFNTIKLSVFNYEEPAQSRLADCGVLDGLLLEHLNDELTDIPH